MITATWRATSRDELRQVGGWVHDAYFDWQRIVVDARRKMVVIPFEQEPTDEKECGQPGPEFVKRGLLGTRIYKVPFVRCTATIRQATSCTIEKQGRSDPGMLDVIESMDSTSEIALVPVTGPMVRVAVDAIDVRVDMTDELAFYVRRKITRLGASDRRWDETSPSGTEEPEVAVPDETA